MHIMRKHRGHIGITRGIICGIGVLLQVVITYVLARYMQEYWSWFYFTLEVISIILVFQLVNDSESYKSFWIIIVLVLPVAGFFLYFMWGTKHTNSKSNRRIREVDAKGAKYRNQDKDVIQEFSSIHRNKVQICRFLINEGFPLYKDTKVDYYDLGEKKLYALIEDLRNAKEFIFLEYFIIFDGEIWSTIKEILKEKVKEKLDVRLLIDDFGCIIINTPEFRKEMAASGIKLGVFAPIEKDLTRFTFNYRNHQKIAIIDGNIGYTGGVNIGDEYANLYKKFGHWKDTAVRLEGDGVWSLTTMFLQMWEITKGYGDADYSLYKPKISVEAKGYVQPLSDGPANNPKNPAEGTYTHMINKARDYIYFTTPYLVLDGKMVDDLCRAAKSGVDVKIITPRVYDKWYVYMVTVSNYGILMENGVHIYEYVPGFIHSKTAVCDDECAICGSINMDYRSFYLHYECGVFMSETPSVFEIKQDILDTLRQCEEIDYETWKNRPLQERFIQGVLKIFSPML